jgi:medium-chain acyl-[acyl-carrier-protein] hydrolase
MTPVLKEEFAITSADIDFTKKLNVGSLTNMFIQSAWHHAEALDFGMDFMHSNGTVWMLSRLRIILHSRPAWNQKVLMTTWPKGIHRVFYQRDFEVLNGCGSVAAAGTSEWLIIDVKARRPKLFNADSHIFNSANVRHAVESPVPVIEISGNDKEEFTRKVMYSDIDLNAHLTTTRYIDWILDTFSIDYLRDNSCKEITLNFIREIPFASEVSISRYKKDNVWQFEFALPHEQITCMRAELIAGPEN